MDALKQNIGAVRSALQTDCASRITELRQSLSSNEKAIATTNDTAEKLRLADKNFDFKKEIAELEALLGRLKQLSDDEVIAMYEKIRSH